MERKLPGWMLEAKSKSHHEKSHPALIFEGKIIFINDFHDCCYICETFLQELETVNHLIVGFDLEWPIQWNKPTRGKADKTALIQVCPSAQTCYLFHVIEWKNLPNIFVNFISHPKVQLVGVNIQCDIWKLARDFEIPVLPIITHNVVELSALANEIFSANQTWSLAKLALYVLKKTLNKPEDVRKSDWAVKNLTAEQLNYAATDAYASLLVYQRLKEIKDLTCGDSNLNPDMSEHLINHEK